MNRVLKQIIAGVSPVAVTYLVFSMDFSSPVKNLIIGLLCLVMVIVFLGLARFRSGRSLASATVAKAAPAILWVAVLALNVLFNWGISTLVLWAIFLLLIVCGFILSAWLEPVEGHG